MAIEINFGGGGDLMIDSPSENQSILEPLGEKVIIIACGGGKSGLEFPSYETQFESAEASQAVPIPIQRVSLFFYFFVSQGVDCGHS